MKTINILVLSLFIGWAQHSNAAADDVQLADFWIGKKFVKGCDKKSMVVDYMVSINIRTAARLREIKAGACLVNLDETCRQALENFFPPTLVNSLVSSGCVVKSEAVMTSEAVEPEIVDFGTVCSMKNFTHDQDKKICTTTADCILDFVLREKQFVKGKYNVKCGRPEGASFYDCQSADLIEKCEIAELQERGRLWNGSWVQVGAPTRDWEGYPIGQSENRLPVNKSRQTK